VRVGAVKYYYFSVCQFVTLLDISRTLIINYRWLTAIGLVSHWQPAKYV